MSEHQIIKPERDAALDEMRGWAVLLMVLYHFVYDLHYFRFVTVDFFSVPLLAWRYTIVLLFLTSVGVSIVLRYRHVSFTRYLRRLTKLMLAALAITIVTYIVFQEHFVFFGILHLIFVASLVGYFFRNMPVIALVAGAIILLINYLDLSYYTVIKTWLTNFWPENKGVDYYPPIPWVAWVLVGIFVGYHRRIYQAVFVTRFGLMQWAGRHALSIYLLHQLVLFGLTWGVYLIVNG